MAGDLFVVVAPSGAGKTSLVNRLLEVELLRQFRMQRAHCTAAEAYDSFCDEVENCLPFIFGASSSIRDLDPDANDEKRLLRGTIVAAVNKMYLDCCFVAMRQEQALWPGILGDLE